MLRNIITTSTVFFSMLIFSAISAQAGGNDWKAKMIADALTAAPPAVTNDATIYAWDKKGQMILLRPGSGPYVCLASGFLSTRVGKPPMPYRTRCALIKMPGILSSTSYRKRIR